MNKLQEIQFDILVKFVDICDKLNLQYYLVCGSALGAVKYSGFIPGDDDIDVALARNDYEIFIKKATEHLPDNYFIQNYNTDPNFPQIYTKLRRSDTTYIEKTVKNIDMNHGIYIDVFPLDGYPKNKLASFVLEIRKKIYINVMYSATDIQRNGKARIIYPFSKSILNLVGNKSIAKRYTKMISSYPLESSLLWCNHGNWQGKLEYAESWQYGKGTKKNFHGIEVSVPEKYDEYLRQKYGDYLKDLPVEEQKGHHYYEICDFDKSYKNYLS